MNSVLFRLKHMLLGWGCVGLIYNTADRWQSVGQVLQPGPIDRLIPFDPAGVWLYLSFFLLIPAAYFSCPEKRLIWLRSAFQLAALTAGAAFLAWPTTLSYPAASGGTLSSSLLAALSQIDSAQNCFPSLHMALTVLAVWALHDDQRPAKNTLFWLWGLGIAFSIIQLRRHLFIDLLAGIALGLLVGWLCRQFLSFSTRLQEGAPS